MAALERQSPPTVLTGAVSTIVTTADSAGA
jgi:hypothetical protein